MATRLPLTIDQGATFSYVVALTDDNGVPLVTTNLTANSAMRKSYTSTLAIPLTASISNGVLTISLTNLQTANLEPGRYVYDVLTTDSVLNTVSRIVEGVITVKPGATR